MLTIEVELAGRARPLTCAIEDPAIELGDRMVVEFGDGRHAFGLCVRVPLDVPWPDGAPLPRALRHADAPDEDRESHVQRQREDWLETARQQATELGVAMRVLRAEPSFAGRKATFHFVAEGRVDFRELVRELARRLRARVELRQIGVRDAAVVQGGVGHCGQSLCCARFLNGFAPVSMRMAKAQGLPLNPTKISGQCGRLMCCLRYELDVPAPAGVDGERDGNGSSGSGDAPPRGRGHRCGGCCSRETP